MINYIGANVICFGVVPPPMRTCVLFFFAGLAANGCIPYAVGTTAEPAPVGTVVPSTVALVAVGQPKINADPGDPDERTTSFSFDSEARFGLDERSDAGVRLAGSSGIVATYKRQLTPSGPRRIATAVMVGGGLLGLGSHAHFEGTFVGSWPYSPTMTPYGGLRVQHALALGDDDPTPNPAIGAFAGVWLGEPDLGVSPELGIFYSPTDAFMETDWVVVPSITVHGGRLLKALGIGF